jgi:hypothetical protein
MVYKLLELLRRRLEFSYPAFARQPIMDVWEQLFEIPDQGTGFEPEFLIEKCLLHPRNLIKLFQHCRAFAVNVGHTRIGPADVAKALEAYARDPVREVDREITDVFPSARRAIYGFVSELGELSAGELLTLLARGGLSTEDAPKAFELLLYYGVIGIMDPEGPIYIYDTQYDMEIMNALIRKKGRNSSYQINPVLWPALRIRNAASSAGGAESG